MNREEILIEATRCVMKDRNVTHGDPEDNFATIARYWQNYLLTPISAEQVAVMMILMKVSRLHTSPEHPDHWVDIAGYAACGGGIATLQKPQIPDSYVCPECGSNSTIEDGAYCKNKSCLRCPLTK